MFGKTDLPLSELPLHTGTSYLFYLQLLSYCYVTTLCSTFTHDFCHYLATFIKAFLVKKKNHMNRDIMQERGRERERGGERGAALKRVEHGKKKNDLLFFSSDPP